MELNPKSRQSDALGNLYRSALFMAKGQVDLSMAFLGKAHRVLGEKLPKTIVQLMNTNGKLTDRKKQLFWAEKIFDQYHLLKNSS